MASPTQCTWVWQALGDGEWLGSLVCCSPWSRKESDTTERLNNYNNTQIKITMRYQLMCVCVLSCFSHVWLFVTLWIVAYRILQARIREWVAMPSSGDLLDPGIEPTSPLAPALQADSLPLSHWGTLARNIAVPTLFGTRDQFHRRQFFHGLGWGHGFRMIQAHCIYYALYFYYYYYIHQFHLRSPGIRC